MSDDPKWMEHAAERMEEKGTVGSFGKATPRKIAAARKEGGRIAKKANFAAQAKKVSHKRSGK